MAENTITHSEATELCSRTLAAMKTLCEYYPNLMVRLEDPDRSMSDLWMDVWKCVSEKVDACGWVGLAAVADLVESWPTADETA